MSFLKKLFGKGSEATPATPANPEVAPANPEVNTDLDSKVAAALGSVGTELVADVAAAEQAGTLDAVPETTPVSADVALAAAQEQLANLPETNEPSTETPTEAAVETFVPPVAQTVEEVPATPQIVESAPISSQPEVAVEGGSATTEPADETQIMGDQFTIKAPTPAAEVPSTGDPESDKIWAELDPAGNTLPAPAEAPAEAPALEATPEQNQ